MESSCRSLIQKWLDGLSNVYTRIGKTKHGVGVIAIKDIPKGTDPFSDDRSDLIPISKKVIDKIKNLGILDMINDFCPMRGGLYFVPRDGFNNIGVGWYLNHSKKPNMMTPDGSLTFITTRRIRKGEELTIDYSTYDEEKEDREEAWRK